MSYGSAKRLLPAAATSWLVVGAGTGTDTTTTTAVAPTITGLRTIGTVATATRVATIVTRAVTHTVARLRADATLWALALLWTSRVASIVRCLRSSESRCVYLGQNQPGADNQHQYRDQDWNTDSQKLVHTHSPPFKFYYHK